MTDVEKEEIKEKMISKTELEVMERDITNNLKISMNQVVDNIINNKGATSVINKLKEVSPTDRKMSIVCYNTDGTLTSMYDMNFTI